MTIRIAINGYGRIGRNCLRAIFESHQESQFQIVAINDLSNIETAAHLTRYDTIHGRFPESVMFKDQSLYVKGQCIRFFSERNPALLPWKELNIDVVFECTGHFTDRDSAKAHLSAGAKKVVISAPGKNVDATIVYGVNHHQLKASDTIISNASCTTNCLAPIAKILNDHIGIEQGTMTTIHAYTNDQNLLDFDHSDVYRSRSATQSMIPTKTGAAKAVGLVLPELKGKLDGMALRVPIINVSVVDLHFLASRKTSIDEVNQVIKLASENAFKDVVAYNDEPLVSIDFNHQPASSIFDSGQTNVHGRWVKVMSWYDNEWGFSNRMLDTTAALMAASQTVSSLSEKSEPQVA